MRSIRLTRITTSRQPNSYTDAEFVRARQHTALYAPDRVDAFTFTLLAEAQRKFIAQRRQEEVNNE